MLGDEDIGFEPCGGQELFSDDQKELYETCKNAIPYLNERLAPLIGGAPFEDNSEQARFGKSPFPFAIFNRMEGSIDTGKMIKSLLKKAAEADITIINGLKLQSFEEHADGVHITTNHGKLETSHLAVCTNGFAKNHLPAAKVEPARNQVVVTSPIPDMAIKGTFHVQQGYIYFRNVGDRLLIGGFRHLFKEQESTDKLELTDNVIDTIHQYISTNLLPDTPFSIDFSWSGIMGVGTSKSYICEKISPRVFCGIRMGGMGVALGSLVGQELGALMARESQT
jgi:glycine/D-amino acid oxidase-like deaminating enzyme